MGRPFSARLAIVVAAAVAGCNLITGVDQLERVDGLGGGSGPGADGSDIGPLPDAGHFSDAHVHDLQDASVPFDAAGTPFDAGSGGDAGATVCQGLTALWRFDGKVVSSQGDTPTNGGNPNYGQGKFGQGMSLSNSQFLRYAAARSGTPFVLPTEGTISVWMSSSSWSYPCHNNHGFIGLDDGNSIYTDCEPDGVLGVWLDLSATTYVGASLVSQNGEWTNGYNHLVATWSQSPPSMAIVLNASVSNSTTAAWTPPSPNVQTFVLSGAPQAPMGVYLDDLAVWTRPLTNAEIATIHGAGKSIGDVCALP
jgi:hypothetical protein